jgi:glycosyltransferase involved in cell wall biosynthesis
MLAVIVPTYNQPHLIEASVLSIVTQGLYLGLAPMVFVVDDGSTTSLGIVPKLDNVKVYRFPKNRGVQEARNYGYYKAKEYGNYSYYLFSDGDVMWLPGAFDTMLGVLNGGDAAYVYCNYERRGAFKGTWHASQFDEDKLKKHNYISTMSILRASCIPDPPFIPDEERLQDWSLWLRLLKEGHKGIHIDKSLFITHYEENGLSNKGIEHHRKWEKIIRSRYV